MNKYEQLKDNYYSMYDYVPIGICVIDESFTIKHWNMSLEGWTNKTQKEMIGENLLLLFPHLIAPKFKVRIDLMFEGRPPMVFSSLLHHYFLPIMDSNGQILDQSATLTSLPTKAEGKYEVLIAIENVTTLTNRVKKYREAKNLAIDELSKRSEAEEKIRQYANELEQLNATKDKFFSIIAHDLINPVSTQYRILQSFIDDFDSYTNDEIFSILEQLSSSSTNTYKLLDNLLTWSRSQLNKIECNKTNSSAKFMIDSIVKTIESSGIEKSIKINTNVPDDNCIFADVNMINTVFRNILSNAIKFTDFGGTIDVSVSVDESLTHISISDNGVGMPQVIVDHIFEIDKSVSTRGTNNELGTGLGLILCKEFVDKNGGEIKVESKLGTGTTFIISLPNC